MSGGILVRVWDDRDDEWARRFSIPMPDRARRAGGVSAISRIEAHPEHVGYRMKGADVVEIEPGIPVWDTRRT